MLVYANAFDGSPIASRDKILEAVARWLTKKEVPRTSASDLSSTTRIPYRSGAHAEVIVAEDDESLYSLRYVHPDNEVVGREWFTEIGIVEDQVNPLRFSVVLRTEEISARVVRPIDATRPGVILELANQGLMSSGTPGLESLLLDDEYAAEGLRYSLAIANRSHPYVIISPAQDGQYLADPETVRRMVVGLADVVRIPAGANTFAISDVLGKDFATWRGAVNVILPARTRPELFVPTIKFLPDSIRDLEASGRRVETEILAAVTHRSNRTMFARHVAPGAVRDRKQRHELSVRKAEAARTGDAQAWVKIVEELNADLEREKASLAEQLRMEREGRTKTAGDSKRRSTAFDLQTTHLRHSLSLRPLPMATQ